MSLVDIINKYEQSLLTKISSLEQQVVDLQVEKSEVENRLQRQLRCKHSVFINLLMKKVTPPIGLEFESRNFSDDLSTVVVMVARKREQGKQSWDEKLGSVPYVPSEGSLHIWLDQEAGFPKLELLIMRDYIARRQLWVEALLTEFHKAM